MWKYTTKLSSSVTSLVLLLPVIVCEDADKSNKTVKADYSIVDFPQLARSPWFVDKTAMIEKFMSLEKPFVETAMPPRFGRSTNLSMLKYFFDVTLNETNGYTVVTDKKNTPAYKLFTDPKLNLSISKNLDFIDKYLGEYIVVHFSLKHLHGKTMEEKVKLLNRAYYEQVCKKYATWFAHEKEYIYSYSSSAGKILEKLFKGVGHRTNIIESNLSFLITILRRYYKRKAILLIDDFHSPAVNAMMMNQDPSRITDFINRQVEQVIQPSYPKHAVERAVFSGTFSCTNTTRFMYRSILENVSACAFLQNHSLSEYYGFTTQEVEHLLVGAGSKVDNNDKKKIAQLYNGYSIEELSIKLHNPASVIRYLKERVGDSPVTPASTSPPPEPVHILMDAAMKHNESRKTMMRLLECGYVDVKEYRNNTVVLYTELLKGVVDGNNTFYNDLFKNFLFYNAYLTRASSDVYKLPNLEMRREFQRAIHSFYRGKMVNLEVVGRQFPIILGVLSHDGEISLGEIETISGVFQRELEKFANETSAFGLQINDAEIRSFFYVCLDVICSGNSIMAEFQVFDGHGYAEDRTDLSIIHPENATALVVEFKYGQSVISALQSAKQHRIDNMKNIFYAGVAVDDQMNVQLDINFTK